jgi:hypothetical protein
MATLLYEDRIAGGSLDDKEGKIPVDSAWDSDIVTHNKVRYA